ncbi:MAG: hypothetical protein BalsKO_26410 [Balneolaceae bacterium]
MKLKRLFVNASITFSFIFFINNCGVGPTEDIFFDPDEQEECVTAEDCSNFLDTGYLTLFQTLVSSYGVNMHLLADQATSTNNVRGFYTASQEPREPINNLAFNGREAPNYETFFDNFQRTNLIATEVISNSNLYAGSERNKVLAKSYLLRGIARGYLGLIFDKIPYYINDDEFEFLGYADLIDSSLIDLNKAISFTVNTGDPSSDSNFDFAFDGVPGGKNTWRESELRVVANSYAARILASKARTYNEALETNWQQVLDYANKGIGSSESSLEVFSLSTIGSNGEFSNQLADWLNQIIEGDFETGAGYIPTDIKILHLLDENYPTEYPLEGISGGQLVLDPANSPDPRLNEYYKNTQNIGFLRQERNTALFSNYFGKRMFADNNWQDLENDIIYFTDSEIEYLKAEAHFMLSQKTEAAAILNLSPAGNGTTYLGFSLPALRKDYITNNSLSGNYQFTGTESLAEIQLVLLREYSVEIDILGGIGVPWFFMRRHDLLQEGTPTMYPLPGLELEILDLPVYSFGGMLRIGEVGTASGANSWKNLRERISN